MRSLIRISLVSLLGSSLVPAVALADHETRQDRRELREDRREAMDDRMDNAQLRQLLIRFDRARAVNDVGTLANLERDLYGLLDAELRESRHELAKDQREASRSRRELREDRRHRRWGDRWEDRRDRNDDIRDVRNEAYELDQKRAIRAELNAVAGRQDPAALDYRRERIVRLLNLGQQELHKDYRERREDRRELREDRRDDR